jgi:ABC-2 type transport system permease protein
MEVLIRAELLKLRTTRMFWGNVAAALLFVPLAVALAVNTGAEPLDSSTGVRNVIAAASSGAVMLLVIGILAIGGEFRHGTATTTFLISPDRRRVVWAKLAAVSLVGVAVATAASLLTLAVALPWLSAKGVAVSSHGRDIALGLLGALAATVLAALVGVGFGSLVRNQTTAITVALIWSQIVEGLVVGFVPAVGRWFPGGAANALAGVANPNGDLLPMGVAALLLAGYGIAFAVAGIAALVRKDIA